MADLYDELKPNRLEKNPAKDEIIQLLNKYKGITKDLDREAARLKGVTNKKEAIARLNKLKKRAKKSIESLKQSAANWAKIAAPKSHLSGQALADNFIKKQSKIVNENGEVEKLFDLKPKDKAAIKKIIDRVTEEVLREVNMINYSWQGRFDDIIRGGIKDARGIKLIKKPGSRGGATTGKEIGSRLYQEIKDEGLKLIDKAGRRWDPERYIRMYSRTRTRELQTQGIEDRMGDYDLDLVKISEHTDVDGMDICNEYEGKVYSLSGNHPKYPKLSMHTPFHPNCVHVETPWVEEFHKNTSAEEQYDYSQEYKELHPDLSDEALKGLEKTHERVLKKGKATRRENLTTIYKKNGRQAFKSLDGDKSEVIFSQELINNLNNADKNSIIMVHNHPSSSSFSTDDLKVLNNFDSIDAMTVEGHDETKYICRIAGGNILEDNSKIEDLYKKYQDKYVNEFKPKVINGELDADTAWKEHSHKIITDLSEELGWEYNRVIPNEGG